MMFVVQTVAVSRLQENKISLFKNRRRLQYNIPVTTYISTERNLPAFTVLRYAQVYARTTDDMTGIRIAKFYTRFYGEPGIVMNYFKTLRSHDGIFCRIQRLQVRQTLQGSSFVIILYIRLLDAGRIFH